MQPSNIGSRPQLQVRATNTRATRTNREVSWELWETPRDVVETNLTTLNFGADRVRSEARGYQVFKIGASNAKFRLSKACCERSSFPHASQRPALPRKSLTSAALPK